MANQINTQILTAQAPRSTLYLGGPALGAQVVPVNAGSGVYGGQTGSVLIKNCNAIPVDNADFDKQTLR